MTGTGRFGLPSRRAALALLLALAFLTACSPPSAPAAPAPPAAPAAPAAQSSPAAPAASAPPPAAASPAAVAPAAPASAASPAAPAAAAAGAQPVAGGKLSFAIGSDPGTLDPHQSSARTDRLFMYELFDPLIALDEQLNLQPGLAEKWEVSPDGLSYTFTLRQGVKFHDGTDLTADIAKWNFDRMLDKSTGSVRYTELQAVKGVTVKDPRTFAVELSAPFTPFLSALTDRAGMMISKAAFEKSGKDGFARQPVGTGPFKFVDWTQKEKITLAKFGDYWVKGQPYLDEVTYTFIPDESVRLSNLRTNQVQIVDGLPPKDLQAVRSNPEFQVVEEAGFAFSYMDLNTAKPPFDNKALRQAVAWGIDRDAIHKAIYFSSGNVVQGPNPNASWAFDPTFKPYARDVAKAKAKLAEAGKPDGFQFTALIFNAPIGQQTAQAMQSQLKEAGIDMQIQLVDAATLNTALTTGDYQATNVQWSGRPDPHNNVSGLFRSDGFINYRHYTNPDVDKLIDQAASEQDRQKRIDLYRQIEKLVVDDAPLIFLRSDADIKAMSTKVQGYVGIPDGMPRLGPVWLKR